MDDNTKNMASDENMISESEVASQTTEAIGSQAAEAAETSVAATTEAVESAVASTTEAAEPAVAAATTGTAEPSVEAAAAAVVTDEPQKLSRKEKKLLKKEQKKQKKLQKKINKKERKKRWKETKKEDRRKLKEHYKDAPWFIRIPRLALRPAIKVFFWLLVATLVIVLIVKGVQLSEYAGVGLAMLHKDDEVTKEQIYEYCPLDEEGIKRIDEYPDIDPNETWTICVYMVGADLEDCDEVDLSETTTIQISDEKTALREEFVTGYRNRLKTYSDELSSNNLPLPEFLYYPEKPVAGSEYVMNETIVAPEESGAASADILEMQMADLSDNIQIVLQTGGATRWENNFVNPNKIQRFLIDKDHYFEELANMPLQRSSDPDTLSDFLRFCNKEYPADHTMLILWDHGGGPFGYGVDTIYGRDIMSIKGVRQALSNVYTADPEHPAFDIIGFDACLMSCIEVTHELYGFASFYALSEETEPGQGWDYTSFLNEISENPSMSPAAVARTIADTYIDFYNESNVNITKYVNMSIDVTFAVIDPKKAEELYYAYSELAKHQLKDAVEDISVLAEIGRCSNNVPHMASDAYDVYNLVDLGCYVDLMIDYYPEECSNIKNLLNEAVIYHRENGSLENTQGMAVYLPGSISSYSGLHYFLDYVYNITEDPYVKALYFYKISGCLNDEMMETVKTLTDAKPQVLDLDQFSAFEKTMPVIDGDTFYIPVSDSLMNMTQEYTFQIALFDEDKGIFTYYGEDEYVYLDGEGNLCSDFDGEWVFLDGQPLALEITSKTISTVDYRSHVLYNGKDAYLIFSFDRDTEEFEIKGIRLFPEFTQDQFNFTIDTKNTISPKPGDSIVPVYPTSDVWGSQYETEGKKIKLTSSSSIEMKPLANGYYLAMADIYDQRGDTYTSKVIGYEISGGKIKLCELNPDFVGTDY